MSVPGGATRLAAGSVLAAVLLAACGGSGASPNSSPGSGGGNYSYVIPRAAQGGDASPSPGPASPSPAATTAPPGPVAPPAAAPGPLTFALMPVDGVTGAVTIQPMGSSYSVTVDAHGMMPGSVHAVHVHFGNCPSAGVHIVALARLVADAGGAGTSTTTVRSAYRGDGRFLIVYAGPNPGPLAACSQLSG